MTSFVGDDADTANVGPAGPPESRADVVVFDLRTGFRIGPGAKGPLVTPDPILGEIIGVAIFLGKFGSVPRLDYGDGVDLAVIVAIEIGKVNRVGCDVESGADGHTKPKYSVAVTDTVFAVSDVFLRVRDVDPLGYGGDQIEGIVRVEAEVVADRSGRSQQVVSAFLIEEAVK